MFADVEDDLYELTKDEFCDKYDITSETYEMMVKQTQEI